MPSRRSCCEYRVVARRGSSHHLGITQIMVMIAKDHAGRWRSGAAAYASPTCWRSLRCHLALKRDRGEWVGQINDVPAGSPAQAGPGPESNSNRNIRDDLPGRPSFQNWLNMVTRFVVLFML